MKTVRYEVMPDICCRCGACVDRCRENALSIHPGAPAVIDYERCTACGNCAPACKLRAIVKKRGLFR